MSTGAWVMVALAALFGNELIQNPYLAYPTAAITLGLLWRTLSPYAKILVIFAAALSAYRAGHRVSAFVGEREAVHRAFQGAARCGGEGEIVESPILRGGRFVVVVDADRIDCAGAITGKHRIRLVGAPDGLARGDRISFVAQLSVVAPPRQLDLTDPILRAAALGVVGSGGALDVEKKASGSGWRHGVDLARAWVRRRIAATYAPKAEALGRALVLGENDLDPVDQVAFQKSGLSHLLAVSGTHLVLAVVSIIAAARAVLLRFVRWSARCDVGRCLSPAGALLALLYADFAGGSGSAWRAAWMLAAVHLAAAFERRLGGLRALAFSVLIGVSYDPLARYDVSFMLSALATAGLVVIGPHVGGLAQRVSSGALRWVVKALSTTLAAMIGCTPLLLVMSPDITLAGLLANVLAGPLGELAALPVCLLHALMAPLPLVERGLALAGSGALLGVGYIAKVSASATWARVAIPPPTAEQLAVIGLGLVAAVRVLGGHGGAAVASARQRRVLLSLLGLATAACVLVLECLVRRTAAAEGRLRVTAIDVGQGDSLLVDLPDGRLMLIDGGGDITGGPDPGQRVLLPLLRRRRRDHIDIAVLTHPHPDHFGGLLTALRALPVHEFWDGSPRREGDQGEVARLRRDLARRGTLTRDLPELCQMYAPRTGGMIQILGPCPNVVEERSANNQSIVIKLELGRHSAVLPGDAETLEEADLVASRGAWLRADLLKLGHHGSRSSTSSEWLAAIRPSLAIVSVGLRNRFGHPHATTLSRLQAAHVPAYRTDELGSVEWSTNGSKVTLRTAAGALIRFANF
jgi:competence protein ComEC